MKRFSIRRRSVSLKEWLRGFLLVAALAAGGEAPAADAGKTVLVLGDSISAAYGLQTENGEPGWVQLLRQRLGPRHGVVNASISGDTTVGGLTRLPRTLAVHKPDIVIIELGGNDGLRGYPVTSIRANLLAMTEAVLAAGAKPVLAGMQMPPNLGPRYTQAFRELYTGIAAETGAALVPFLLEGVATDEALDAARRHPSQCQGAAVLARQRLARAGTLVGDGLRAGKSSRTVYGSPNDGHR